MIKIENITLAFVLILFLLSSCYNPETQVDFQNPEDTLHLIVPLYSFPTDEDGFYWYSVAKAANEVPITIIFGLADSSEKSIYQQWLPILHYGKFATVVCYIATSNGERPIEEIKNWLNFYVKNFNIDGVFFDEVNSSWNKFQYYETIISYARQFPEIKQIILNSPYASPQFVDSTSANLVVIFENTGFQWNKFDVADYQNIIASKKAVIVHSVWFKTKMKTIIEQAVLSNIAYVFVTNKEYDKLPSYWDEEIRLVKDINQN